MENNIIPIDSTELESSVFSGTVYKKSWTAYVKPVLIFLFLFFLFIGLMANSILLGLFPTLASLLYFAYSILYRMTYKLYLNKQGIWVHRGVLPWEKGVYGLKWRDLDEAVYFNSMSSHFFKSYDLTLRHRFTKSNEIILSSMHNGHKAVMEINRVHDYLIENRMI